MIKKLFITNLLIACAIGVYAQHLDLQYAFGSGGSYMVEHFHENGNEYRAPFTTDIALRWTPKDSYFNVKLSMQYVFTRFKESSERMVQYVDYGYPYYGEVLDQVSTYTLFAHLERLKSDKKLNFGYNLGLGFTFESLGTARGSVETAEKSRYMSLQFSGIAAYKFGERSAILLEPKLFWTNPATSFNREFYRVAGEDISAFLTLGYSYRLF